MSEPVGQKSKSIQTLVVDRRPILRAMLNPKTIALIGATEAPNSVGRTLMENLISSGQAVYPINLKRTSVLGAKAFPRIADAPAAVDLAIIATPAATVPEVISECASAGVTGAVIISTGFRESGSAGQELEREVLQLCRSGRISWPIWSSHPQSAGLFKWRQFEPEMILLAVGWYLRFSLSYRDVEELLAERGLHADHVTVWRWVQRYGPEIQRRLRPRLRPTNDSWRVDETYIRVKGKWVYLYRAVDSSGATIDFLLSAKRDAATAQRFLTKALGGENHPHPRVINTDKYAAYPPAIVQLKDEGVLEENCQHRLVQYLNNVLEQDHRAIKRRVRASQHFRSFWGAWRTIAGYEAIHMIRKGQACCSGAGAEVGLLHRFILGLFAATN